MVISSEFAGRVLQLSDEPMYIGRADDNDITIKHGSVSRAHAEVTRDASTRRYHLRNLSSTNALRVNGEEQTSIALEDGDVVDLGHVRMRYESRDGVAFGEAGPASLDRFLIVGDDPVSCRDNVIRIGDVAFRVADVRDYALHGANLPLPKQRVLQAALAMFVVVASEEARKVT